MVKKKLPESVEITTYTMARLVKSQTKKIDKWYIEFQQGVYDEPLKRFRPTFNLNRIENRKERRVLAEEIIERIDEMLKDSVPAQIILANIIGNSKNGRIKFVADPFPQRRTPVSDAFNSIIDLKCSNEKKNSAKNFNTLKVLFTNFLESKKLVNKRICDFNRNDATAFMDSMSVKYSNNTTFNNRLRDTNIIFKDLLMRDYIVENPFCGVRYKKKMAKSRRDFNNTEKEILAKYFHDNHFWMFRAILLQYYCFIRPSELARLKFKDFNLKNGTIHLDENMTKNGKSAILTIPQIVLCHFMSEDFSQQPTNYFVFGSKFKPNPNKSICENGFNNLHSQVLKKLLSEGKLDNIKGLSFYSWKDTGITDMANDDTISIFKTSNHARHQDTKTTMLYYHASDVVPQIRQYNKVLF